MKKLLIATQNQHKLKELKVILKHLPFAIIGLDQLGLPKKFQVKETGSTFCQNAVIKATAYAEKTNLLTIADDSGLMIDYLNMNKILQLLKAVPQLQRQAHFSCCIALYNPDTNSYKTFTGSAHGWIAFKPQGNQGFGYDPIFFSPDLNKTFGQALPAEKNRLSHRAKALKKLTNHLQSKI